MWQFDAACGPEHTELMFSILPSKVERMKAICNVCPVAVDCLMFALDPDNEITEGIWGGYTAQERKEFAKVNS